MVDINAPRFEVDTNKRPDLFVLGGENLPSERPELWELERRISTPQCSYRISSVMIRNGYEPRLRQLTAHEIQVVISIPTVTPTTPVW